MYDLPVIQNVITHGASPSRITNTIESRSGRRRWIAYSLITWRVLTWVQSDLTKLPGETCWTRTTIRVDAINARGIVGATIVNAIVDLSLTVLSSESRRATTSFIAASTTVIASTVIQKIIWTFGIDHGRYSLCITI